MNAYSYKIRGLVRTDLKVGDTFQHRWNNSSIDIIQFVATMEAARGSWIDLTPDHYNRPCFFQNLATGDTYHASWFSQIEASVCNDKKLTAIKDDDYYLIFENKMVSAKPIWIKWDKGNWFQCIDKAHRRRYHYNWLYLGNPIEICPPVEITKETPAMNKPIVSLSIFGSKDDIVFTGGLVRIGCAQHHINYWLDNHVQEGISHGYNPDQIIEYKKYLDAISILSKALIPERKHIKLEIDRLNKKLRIIEQTHRNAEFGNEPDESNHSCKNTMFTYNGFSLQSRAGITRDEYGLVCRGIHLEADDHWIYYGAAKSDWIDKLIATVKAYNTYFNGGGIATVANPPPNEIVE